MPSYLQAMVKGQALLWPMIAVERGQGQTQSSSSTNKPTRGQGCPQMRPILPQCMVLEILLALVDND